MKTPGRIPREQVNAAFYAFAVLYWIYLFAADSLMHQLAQPVLIYPRFDYTFWGLVLSGIPQWLTGSPAVALIFDWGWLACVLGALIFPRRLIFHRGYAIGAFLHFCIYNIYAGTHFTNVAFLMMSWLLIWRKDSLFELAFEALRYLFLFVFFSAACWKLLMGSLWHDGHFAATLRFQVLDYMVAYPESIRTALYHYLIFHPMVAQLCWVLVFSVQFLFIIGFFTKRYDRLLIGLGFAFHIGSIVFANIPNLEFLVCYLLLLPWSKYNEPAKISSGQLEIAT